MTFLAWAWQDSYRHHSHLMISSSRIYVAVRSGGKSYLSRFDSFTPYNRDIAYNRQPARPSLPAARELTLATHAIPDALIFSTALTLWLGWLTWHWKRERRNLTA